MAGMPNEEFLSALKDIVERASVDKSAIEYIKVDVQDLLDEDED